MRMRFRGFICWRMDCQVYDGDTPMDARGDIRAMAQLLITNPDMLHCSVLPVHSQFARLLGHLRYGQRGDQRLRAATPHLPSRHPPLPLFRQRYIVIDEGHYYTGVFGAHTALVLRRLRRVCETCYNSSPQFIVTSATMANPKSHAQVIQSRFRLGVALCSSG